MATITNNATGDKIPCCSATTSNSASSYGVPVWADSDGQAYMQVGMDNPIYSVSLGADDARAAIAKQLRERRQELNLTLQWLAEASGVGYATISRLENGGTANIDTYCRLASALGCSLSLVPDKTD